MKVQNETHIRLGAGDVKLGAVNGGLRQELPSGTSAVVIHTDGDGRYERLALRARQVVQIWAEDGIEASLPLARAIAALEKELES